MDLCFDDHYRTSAFSRHFFIGINSFINVMRNDTFLNFYTKTGEQFFALVFMEIHRDGGLISGCETKEKEEGKAGSLNSSSFPVPVQPRRWVICTPCFGKHR